MQGTQAAILGNAMASAQSGGLQDILSRIPPKGSDPKKVEAAAKEFESIFLAQMLQHMFEGVGNSEDSYFGGGNGEEMWKSMLVDEYGKILSNAGGVGIADSVQQELLKLQEIM